MNALGFFIGRIAWQLGFTQERTRWNSVTRETQQLAETQDMLGKLAWPGTRSIERLSGEYWQITDLQSQQARLRGESDQLLQENDHAQDRLYQMEDAMEDDVDALRRKKTGLMSSAVTIMDQVEEIRDRDNETRRRFTSLKGKLEVLKKLTDGDYTAELERTRLTLAELKEKHSADLAAIASLEQQVRALEVTVQGVDAEIAGLRERHKVQTADLVAEIGRRSKQIAEISARLGSLDSQKNEFSFMIGQYLSDQIDNPDPEIKKVLRNFTPLTRRIVHLRRSIQYNRRLARRSSR
jgi:chromosome segregation ATPase